MIYWIIDIIKRSFIKTDKLMSHLIARINLSQHIDNLIDCESCIANYKTSYSSIFIIALAESLTLYRNTTEKNSKKIKQQFC